MIRKIVWLAAAIVLAVSIVINILAFAGILNPQSLVKEKDQVIAQFEERVKTLEEKNKALEESQAFLESKLEKFMATYTAAKAELSGILKDYRELKGGQP
jgi:chromosome segregation ATPase